MQLTEDTERFPDGFLFEFIVFQQPIAGSTKGKTAQESRQIRYAGEESGIA